MVGQKVSSSGYLKIPALVRAFSALRATDEGRCDADAWGVAQHLIPAIWIESSVAWHGLLFGGDGLLLTDWFCLLCVGMCYSPTVSKLPCFAWLQSLQWAFNPPSFFAPA
jgi:hypothetical protein